MGSRLPAPPPGSCSLARLARPAPCARSPSGNKTRVDPPHRLAYYRHWLPSTVVYYRHWLPSASHPLVYYRHWLPSTIVYSRHELLSTIVYYTHSLPSTVFEHDAPSSSGPLHGGHSFVTYLLVSLPQKAPPCSRGGGLRGRWCCLARRLELSGVHAWGI